MTDTTELRLAALEIFEVALKSVDARVAVRKAIAFDGSRLKVAETSFDLSKRRAGVYAIAIGKAALSMASALDSVLGERIKAGIVVGPSARRPQPSTRLHTSGRPHTASISIPTVDFYTGTRWRLVEGGHPLPDRASLLAAQLSFELLERAEAERAPVIFLISGGGSAMIEWPRDERITLRDLRAANRVLVSCGAGIAEINAVRRAFSAVKGGGLSERAPHAAQLTLIISDTGEGEEATVASGPTMGPPDDAPDARGVVARYGLAERLPASILRAINQPAASKTTLKATAPRRATGEYYVLLDNRRAMEAAARAARKRAFVVEVARDLIEQPVADACTQMLSRLLELRRRRRVDEQKGVCLVSGGEFACPVRGTGVGGRNAETTLRCAIEMDERNAEQSYASSPPASIVALSVGTDGIDGNSPAAGALADQTTIRRATQRRLDAQRFLNASDAYSFFNALGDAVVTGPTGTNVRDLRILLAS